MTNDIVGADMQDVVSQSDAMLSVIERVALDPNSDIDKLERMLAMKERMDAQSAKAAHSASLVRAMMVMPDIPMNGMGHNNRPYSTLADITKTTRPILSDNGLALTFDIQSGDAITVTAVLCHIAGHSSTVSITLPKDTSGNKNVVQAVGSSQTYGQRYTAQAILGLSLGDDVEDDGKQASTATITADQFFTLQGLIEKSSLTTEKFNKSFGGNDQSILDEFPADKFDEAVKRLNANIAIVKAQTNE